MWEYANETETKRQGVIREHKQKLCKQTSSGHSTVGAKDAKRLKKEGANVFVCVCHGESERGGGPSASHSSS